MNKAERFASTEHTIRQLLAQLAQLETTYAITRATEIAAGQSSRKPFLRSRMIARDMRILINKIRAVESRHNRYANADTYIEMVERIITEENVFKKSREILTQIYEHSAKIRVGISKNKNAVIFMGGYSPTAEKQEVEQQAAKQEIVEKQKAVQDMIDSAKEKKSRIKQLNEDAVMSLLSNAPSTPFSTEEEESSDEQD